MADWSTTLDGLPGLSAAQKGKARVILMAKSENEASLLVSGPPDVASEAILEILRREESAAGLGMASAAGAGEANVLATIKARAPCSDKYAAHLLVLTSPPHKEAATVVGPHHVATYAHGEHATWNVGLKLQVAVHCPQVDRRMLVDAEVVYHDTRKDVAILKVQHELAPPVLDTAVWPGDKYYVHGQSTQAQADDTSICHGMMAATELDAWGHIRGDIMAGAGDSGGGCFSVATGKLIAMMVGSDGYTNKAILVPSLTIHNILMDL